jgi:TRAP-type mannitol/chloroaromatic compound transport system substrate-binding protein
MRKLIIFTFIFTLLFSVSSFAKSKRQKFGVDSRHVQWQHKKFTTSKKVFHWRMGETWTKGLLFHDIAQHFCDSVRAASGGRLNIKLYQAGAIVPAMELFDAVRKGVLQCGHDWSGYWKGKNEAIVCFASVPYGLDAEGYNLWLYARDGIKLWNEIYKPYGLVVFPGGVVGQEMGLFSNKKATKMADFKGMRVRTVGWYMDILTRLGASVSPLPGGEVYLALERGVIDAAEFSTPAIDLPMGFDDITKYVIEPGVHQPASQCEIIINEKAYNQLPDDLKAIVSICSKETQLWGYAWSENLNAKAVEILGKKVQYVKMDKNTIIQFRKTTHDYTEELKKKYPDVKKVLDSQEKFIKEFAKWRDLRSGVAPWPYEDFIKGKLYQ